MRDIKFRGFDKETKTMVYPEDTRYMLSLINGEWSLSDYAQLEYETDEYGLYDIELPHETSDIEVMQYTGMKDVNGVEIYEDDVLFHPLQGRRKVYYPYSERVASYGLRDIDNGFGSTLQDSHAVWEVIGNVYENKELSEEK